MKKALSVILSLLMIITTISALPFSASAEPSELSYKVTFTPNENFQNWDNVYFYYSPGGCAWPGEQMTKSGGNYSVTINPDAVPSYFIINNGSGTMSDDLELSYDLGFNSGGSEIDVITPTKIGTCTITENITYYDGELGAIYSPESTTFRYWAPDATSVNLGIVGNVDQPMQKLMDGTQWTGVWTITLTGNYLNYRYYFVVDGVNKSDPYGKESNGYFGTMVTTSEATNPYGWNSDNHYFFDNNESSGVMSFVDVGSFLSDATAGVRMDRYGKYLAVLDDRSSVNNAGNVATGNYFLHYYSDIDSVCIDIASSSNLMLPKLEYASYMYTDEGVMVNEVKQMIQALHNIGLAVILNLDFTSAPFTGDMLTKYIVDTCTYWANEYHIDGFVLKEMISTEAEAALKSALDEIDTRFFLAGTSTYRLRNENYLSGIATMPQTGSPIPNQIRSLMTDQTGFYTHEAGNMDDLMLTIAAMSRGRMTLNFGQEFGGYGNPVDWSKLGNSYNYETEEAVFEHTYSYFRQLMEIRKNFAPLYSVKGTQQASTSGNTVVCTYTNTTQRTDEWQKMKVLINLNTNERSFNNNDNWVVIAKSGTTDGTVDYKNGLEVINGTNVSVAAKSAVIMVDKASFDELNAPPPVSYNINIGGTDITSANANDVFGDGTVKYNDETKTLTLNNFTYEGAGIHFDNAGSEMTLELIGTNTIKETSGANGSTALLFKGSLKVTGSGTLNAIVCDATGDSVGIAVQEQLTVPEEFTGVINATSGNGSGSAFVHGIFCWGEAVISGGTINATGGTGQRTYGMECGSLTVNGGTVNATGGNTTDRAISGSYGIAANMSFTVNGGTVTARSGRTANRDYCWSNGLNAITIRINGGVVDASSDFATSGSIAVNFDKEYGSITIADGIFATASENNDGSGAVAYNKNDNDNYKWFKSEPIPPHVHNHTPVITNPTCTEQGYTTWTCTCGDSYVDTYKDALGHDFGQNEKVCKRCGTNNPNYIPPEDAKLPTEKKTEEIIKKTNTDKKDVSGTQIKRLMLKATAKKQTITLSWKKISGAQGYIIYGGACGKDMKRLATVKNAKTVKKTFKKLKKGKYYKYMVVAYKKTADGNNRVICKSKSVHCCTDGGKKGNPKSISVKKAKLTVKKGKTVKINPTLKSDKKVETHIAKFRYESSNTKVATVDKNGKVKGKKKGTATVYVYAQDGKCKTVKITVKK